MALKSKKLSKAQIQKDTTLLKRFLFDFIDELYKDLITITRQFSYKESKQNQKGKFIFDFNRLTKLKLIDIIFESIIEITRESKSNALEIGKLCKRVRNKLCHTKFIFLKPESVSNGELDARDFAGNLPYMFTEDLHSKLFQVATKDTNILWVEEILKETKYTNDDLLKESSDTKPIFIGFDDNDTLDDLEMYECVTTGGGCDHIHFLTFKGKSKTKRIIRPSDLKI